MLRMKKVLKGIIRGLDHIVNFIALSLILAAMFLSGYMLWDSHQVYQTADAKNYEAYIPTEKSTKSFEELQKINPDVIGWIRVNDTNINYPLVQTDNDDTYMNTDAEGNYSLSGAIFLHCANKPDFSDFDNIIYGHHMEKHMMFGDIGEFTKEQYFNEHPYGNLFFDGKDHGIEFYALMQVDAYNETIFNVCLDTPEAKQEYLQEIENNVLYKRDMNITEDDHLVLLTTCTSDMTNGRNILVGRLTDQIYPEKEKAKNVGTGIDELKNAVGKVPVIVWFILIVLVLILIARQIEKKQEERRRGRSMRTTRLTKIAMVIFLSMIFFLGVQRPVLAADRNTTVKIPVEQIFEVNNSADADKTGSYVLIADQIQNPMPDGSNGRTFTWNMSGNSSTELIMNVGQAGEYHYKLYQATENKENYTYDSKTYDVTIEGFFDSNNELMAVTVVKNENGDKVSKVSFKNSYTGQTGKNQNPVPSSPRSKDIIHNGSPVKTGDDSPVAGYLFLFFGSVICLSGLLMEKQKNRKEDAKNEA